MAVNKDGKFTKLDDKTIKLLEEAFAMDCPVTEACLFANITTPTYYSWIKKNPKLEERFNALRENPFLIARTTILKGISESPQYAFEYMKRKKRKEFGDSIDHTTKNKEIKPLLGGQSNGTDNTSDNEITEI